MPARSSAPSRPPPRWRRQPLTDTAPTPGSARRVSGRLAGAAAGQPAPAQAMGRSGPGHTRRWCLSRTASPSLEAQNRVVERIERIRRHCSRGRRRLLLARRPIMLASLTTLVSRSTCSSDLVIDPASVSMLTFVHDRSARLLRINDTRAGQTLQRTRMIYFGPLRPGDLDPARGLACRAPKRAQSRHQHHRRRPSARPASASSTCKPSRRPRSRDADCREGAGAVAGVGLEQFLPELGQRFPD